DPELILFMNSKSCKEGCAHNLLCYPDGHAGYVKYNPSEFEHTIRWMVKTHEEQALGFSMPGTAQTDGYIEEQRKGNIKSLPPNESVKFSVETGVLRPIESEKMKEKIYQIKLQNDKRI